MKSSCVNQWLLAVVVSLMLQPASAWFLQARTSTLPRSRGYSTTCTMTATPASDGPNDVSASLTRGEWLKAGASLAAIAPVLSLGKNDEALAVTSSGALRRFGITNTSGIYCCTSAIGHSVPTVVCSRGPRSNDSAARANGSVIM